MGFFFWDRVFWTICPSWSWTTILLISASWVAGIRSMSHRAQPLPPFKQLLTGFILLFSYMCMKYFDHIHLPFTFFFHLSHCFPVSNSPPFFQSCHLFLFIYFRSRFCTWEITHSIYLSESDLLHLTWWLLVPSIFLQMTSSYWVSLHLSNTPLCIMSLFICPSIDGHLGWFHSWAIVSSAAVNTGVQCLFYRQILI
jgi:hypothetical protein